MVVNILLYGTIVGAVIYVIITSGSNKGGKGSSSDKKPSTASGKSNKKNTGSGKTFNSSQFLNFEDILSFEFGSGKMGVIKQPNNRFLGVLEVKGINFNLLSNEEVMILENSYQRLLNGLDFPIQIFVQSKKLDVSNYTNRYKERKEEIIREYENKKRKNELLKEKGDIDPQRLDFELNKTKNQIIYAERLIEFIEAVCGDKLMLEKKYYFIIPYSRKEIDTLQSTKGEEIEPVAMSDIKNKAMGIMSALAGAGLPESKILTPEEILELLYSSYNKGDSESYKSLKALKSKFNHLITTVKEDQEL